MTAFRTDGVHGFYPIVPKASEVVALLDQGARTIQLRVKSADPGLVAEQVAEAVEAGRAVSGAQVVVNDHASAAVEAGAAWVHLGQEDLDTADHDTLRAAGVSLGISSHSPGERRRARAWHADYIALGPIFPTLLKRMRFAPQGPSRLAVWRDAIDVPLVAIGGITLDHLPVLRTHGADAVAVVGAVRTPDRSALDPRAVDAWIRAFEHPSSL